MEFKQGSKVIIVKNLGPQNHNDRGSEQHYYYRDPYNIHKTPLQSKGSVTRIEGDQVWVKIDEKESAYKFHKDELKILEEKLLEDKISKKYDSLPSYMFNLASQMPVFLLNDRLYVLGEAQKDLKENFFQTTKKGKIVSHSIVESASLKSLEELAESHFFKEFEKFRNEYLQEVIKEKKEEAKSSRKEDNYKLVDFIVNKVFPYLRNKTDDNSKINKLFGVEEAEEEIRKDSELQNEDQNKNEEFFSPLIKKIENEKFLSDKKKDKKQKVKKLDLILGYNPDLEVNIKDLPKNYAPESLIGKVLAGRNIAIINNLVYYLIKNNDKKDKNLQTQILNFEGKDYSLVSTIPVNELKNKFYFELSKKVRIETLKTKAANDKKIREFLQNNSNLESLVNKNEYREEDFGFIKYSDCYYVFLQVPQHVLKMPDNYQFLNETYDDYYSNYHSNEKTKKEKRNRYYHFDKVRVAIRLFIDQGKIQYCNPITIERYSHPFTDGPGYSSICLGNYNYYDLKKLEPDLAVATLLKDTKRTLLSGYVDGGTRPYRALESFGHRRLTLEEIKKRKLPITNINLGGKK